MARRTKNDPEQTEYQRLLGLFEGIPQNKIESLDGILHEAARLKCLCNDLWEDLKKNGKFEVWIKAGEEYERERDASKAYRDANRLYQSIMKEIDSKLPAKEKKTGFDKLDDDD